MNVLFIAGADQHYGTYTMSKRIIDSTKELENTVNFTVVTQKRGPLNSWCDERSIKNIVLPYKYCVYYPHKNKILNLVKYAIKYLSVTYFNKKAIRLLKKEVIIDEIDIIHTNINRDLFGMQIARRYNIPNITYLREYSRAHFGLKPIYKNQISWMNKFSEQFVAISNAVKNDWVEFGLDANKIKVVYDGLDTIKYIQDNKQRTAGSGLRIIMCGAIYEGKGQKQLLKAVIDLLNKGLNLTVDFYGEAVDRKYMDSMVSYVEQNKTQNNIHFRGYSDDLSDIMNGYDVGVVCSKAEGFGLVTVEYLLSGLTVIATDTGANSELLENGKYGYLYPYGDIEKLSQLISKIYNHENRGASTAESREYASEKFSIEKTSKDVYGIYCSVIGNR